MGYINRIELDLINKIRILWMQHSEWTRMAFVSIIFKNPDKKEVVARLLRNPKDFGEFLKSFYGENVAHQFCQLLTEHLNLAADLVKATMAGDTIRAEKINKRLYENADEISALLASINPYWHYNDWRRMLYRHLDLAKMIATQMLEGKYQESIITYDQFEAEVMMMADMMATGILRQFFHYLCRC